MQLELPIPLVPLVLAFCSDSSSTRLCRCVEFVYRADSRILNEGTPSVSGTTVGLLGTLVSLARRQLSFSTLQG